MTRKKKVPEALESAVAQALMVQLERFSDNPEKYCTFQQRLEGKLPKFSDLHQFPRHLGRKAFDVSSNNSDLYWGDKPCSVVLSHSSPNSGSIVDEVDKICTAFMDYANAVLAYEARTGSAKIPFWASNKEEYESDTTHLSHMTAHNWEDMVKGLNLVLDEDLRIDPQLLGKGKP